MRKLDPAGVRKDFADTAQDIIDFYDRASSALSSTPHGKGDRNRLSTSSFLTLFVAFERFLSDLFFAYLNKDFSAYQATLEGKLKQAIVAKHGEGVWSLVSVKKGAHVPVAQLETIVDPSGWNLTFVSADALKQCGKDWLVANYASRVSSITASEGRLIDTARALRNFIAHQSAGSKVRMNEALTTVEVGGHNKHLGRGVNAIHSAGSYLKATSQGKSRLHRYAEGLVLISAHV